MFLMSADEAWLFMAANVFLGFVVHWLVRLLQVKKINKINLGEYVEAYPLPRFPILQAAIYSAFWYFIIPLFLMYHLLLWFVTGMKKTLRRLNKTP